MVVNEVLTVNLEMCGCADLWICGFADLRICGFADVPMCGFVDLWICGLKRLKSRGNIQKSGSRKTWSHFVSLNRLTTTYKKNENI